MSPAPNDGMEPDYSGAQSASPDFEPSFQRPEFNPQPVEGGAETDDLYQPMPGNFIGGLDHIRARKQRDIDKMLEAAQKSPVYKNPDGTLTRQAPQQYLSGEFIPMGGEAPYRIENPAAKPVQYGMAQQMQEQFNFPTLPNGQMLSDAMIYQQAPQIWQNLLQSSDGTMNPQTFLSSPFWDHFKGLDNDTLAALKTSIGKAIQPFYKPYVKKQQTMNQVKDSMSDPETGGLFVQFYKPFEQEISMKAGSQEALSLLAGIKSKATQLSEDPDAMAAFQEMAKTSTRKINPEDNLSQEQINDIKKQQGYFRVLMEARSGNAFSNILNRYINYKDSVAQHRNKLNEMVSNKFEDASGADELQGALSKAVESGYYDGKEWMLKSDLDRMAKHDDQVKIGNQMVPGAKMLFDEKKAINQIEQLRKDNYADSDIYVTPDRRVIAGKHLEEFENNDIKVRFPDSGVKGNGQYVALPADFFRDENQQEIFLTAPGNNDVSPVTYVRGEKQYVRRDLLDKLGISKKDLADDLKTGNLMIGRSKKDFIAQSAMEYKPQLINAEQFMDKNVPDGQRFTSNKEFQSAMDIYHENLDRSVDKALLVTMKPDDPGYIGEFTKGAVRQFGKELTTGAATIGEGYAGLYNLLKTGFYKIAGDTEAANQSWSDAMSVSNHIKNVTSEVDEAANGGWLGLDKIKETPSDDIWVHRSAAIGEMVGGLAGIATEMAATQGMGTTALSARLASMAEKFTLARRGLNTASALAGHAGEIAKIKNVIGMAHTVVAESLNFMAMNALTGHSTPTELAEGGIEGAILGLGKIPGRGFFSGKGALIKEGEGLAGVEYKPVPNMGKVPWYADKARLVSATMAAGAVYGLDSIIKSQHGMTADEQLKWWKQPENMAGMALQLIMPYFGGHTKYEGQNMPRTTPLGPEQPTIGDYSKRATTSELASRGAALSDQVEAAKTAGVVPPKEVLDEHAKISKALDTFKQDLILKDAQAKDLEQWKTVNDHVNEQLKEIGKAPEKTMGLTKASKPQTYDEAQKRIDEIEDRLSREGVNTSKLVSKSTPEAKILLGHEDWKEMPADLESAYKERDEIGSGELSHNISEITSLLDKEGLSKKEISGVLQHYSLNPDRVGPVEQAHAAEHTKKAALSNPEKQAEKIAYTLANERGEMFDELRDISPKTLKDAAKAAKSIREYFTDQIPKADQKLLSESPDVQQQVQNTLKIRKSQRTVEDARDRIELMDKAEEKKGARDVAGFGEVNLEKTDNGWTAKAKLRNRAGVAQFDIPDSKELSRSQAEFLATDHFSNEHSLASEKMQGKIRAEIYGESEKAPGEEISEVDKEVANAVFSNAFDGGKSMSEAAKKLTTEKYGFSKEDVSSMLLDFMKERGMEKAKMRDFLKNEAKEMGC